MRKYTLITTILILFIPIYYLRSMQIWNFSRNVSAEKDIRVIFTLKEDSDVTISKQIIEFNNYRIELKPEPRLYKWDKIEVIGTVDDEVIGVFF